MTPEEAAWRPLRPDIARNSTDARLQLHHAAQLVSAIGISYLPPQPDDSHTNLEWLATISSLASHAVSGPSPIRLAVRPHPFALLLLDAGGQRATLPLHGCTVAEAANWVRQQLAAQGVDATAYTLAKHFTIPPHAVAESAPFDATDANAFDELGAWYANAALVLDAVVAQTPNASAVRCWPHHFDLATLIEIAPGNGSRKTISLGMEPGDSYYAEPYFYASMYPSPAADEQRGALDGGGMWHTREWIGAVLPASRVGRDGQRAQLDAFVASAIRECTVLLRRG